MASAHRQPPAPPLVPGAVPTRPQAGGPRLALCQFLLPCLLLACASTPATPEATSNLEAMSYTWYGEAPDASSSLDSQPHVLWAGSGGIPPGASTTGPRGRPLTRARLVQLANGIGLGLTSILVRSNWEVGRAFQLTVGRSLDIQENFQAFDVPASMPPVKVVPDGVIPAMRISAAGLRAIRLDGAFIEILDEDFFETKAQKRSITLATGRRQILGFIKVLAQRRPRGTLLGNPLEPPRPATPVDTSISSDVSWEAGRQGVAIYQAAAWEDDGLITVGPFQQLTHFADVPPRFQLKTTPQPLRL
jgi:hypothetical protein